MDEKQAKKIIRKIIKQQREVYSASDAKDRGFYSEAIEMRNNALQEIQHIVLAEREILEYYMPGIVEGMTGKPEKGDDADWHELCELMLRRKGPFRPIKTDLLSISIEHARLDGTFEFGDPFTGKTLPRELLEIPGLTCVHLESTRLDPAEWKKLPRLRELEWSQANLHGIPDSIFELTNLSRLAMAHCDLRHISGKLSQLTKLKQLNFANNYLGEIPECVFELRNLDHLNFSGNRIHTIDPKIVALKKLSELNLSNNRISRVPSEIVKLKKLDRLLLSKNRITQMPSNMAELNTAIFLDIKENPIGLKKSREFKAFKDKTDLVNELFWQAETGNPESLKKLMRKGIDINTTQDMTLLMAAASAGNLANVKYLLDAGANVNAFDPSNMTALMWAADAGHIEIVRVLIDAKADVTAMSHAGYTALMYAAGIGSPELIELLIQAGSDVHVHTAYGASALSIAKEENQEIVELLHRYGAWE